MSDQLAVDFSEQCMLRQRELCGPSRPEMGNAVMDCTRLGLRPASVDVCIDKGTLDALLCIDERSEEAVDAMAREVRRVVRPDGLWVIISFNTPATVVPFVQEAAEADRSSGGGSVTALIACEALHSSCCCAEHPPACAAQRRPVLRAIAPVGDEALRFGGVAQRRGHGGCRSARGFSAA